MSGAVANVIERREFKFLIDAATQQAIRAAIKPFCTLDPWAARNPRGRYTIESLYLDTAGLSLFWANDHEQVDRIKMRVRGYPEVAGSPVFFEVKRRVNDIILKTRGRVGADEWGKLLRDPAAPIPTGVKDRDRKAVERFLAIHRSMHLKPLTLVRYEREPYFSNIDDYARVTFDTAIRAQPSREFSFASNPRAWRALDDAVTMRTLDSLVVLELKFTTHVPLWLVNIVERLGLVRRAFSKYGTSIRAFYAPVDARTAAGWR
ncbi:MAG: polyphosphate polymerase domain-containing protein [Myxococcales bacterium]|nr:polyphosphate polymerase domain-containing protein [Myxococcales bacterium]